jgi:hypothetical protein
MAEERIGKKPDQKGGPGTEKEAGGSAEVAGHSRKRVLYTCFNCGAANYVDPDWKWFTCWNCGPPPVLNYMD